MSLLNYVPYVLSCSTCLVPYVLTCPTCLGSYVLYVPRVLRALVPPVPRALRAFCVLYALMPHVPYVLWCSTCSRASYHTCNHAMRTSYPMCSHASRALVPYMVLCLVPYLFSYLTCFTCSGTSRVLHVLEPHVSFVLHFFGMLVTRTLQDLCS